jgi:hypothetical protein
MKRVLSLIVAACAMLLCACTSGQAPIAGIVSDAVQLFSNAGQTNSDSQQLLSVNDELSETPKNTAATTTKSASAPSGDWWEQSEGFSKFSRYTYGGDVAMGYEKGAVLAENGAEQYLLKNVTYQDYKSYVDELLSDGFKLYDPYGGFVEQTELELSVIYGSTVFEKENSRLYIEYHLYSKNLRMEVLTNQKTF